MSDTAVPASVPARPGPMKAERRWPMAAAVLFAAVLQFVTPRQGRLSFWWLYPIFEVLLLIVVILQDPGRIDRRTALGRRLTITLIAVMTIGTGIGLSVLMHDILVSNEHVTATALLGRGAGLWVKIGRAHV